MKKLRFLPLILAFSIPLAGCSPKKTPGDDTDKGKVTFKTLKEDIVKNHNYTFEVESYYKNFPEERFDGVYYNLDNEVFYGTDPQYVSLWQKGYTRVKDQGVAEFYLGLNSTEVVIDHFVATNPNLKIYDINGAMIEYIFEAPMKKVNENHYTISDQDIVGIVGTYAGLELSYIHNPKKIDLVRNGDTILITSILRANYYDEETLEPIENEPVYVGLKVKNIGKTSNKLLSNFAKAESSKLPAVTSWDGDIRQDFTDHFGGFIPPIISGLGYSFYHETSWNGHEQRYDIMGQDFTSGDRRSSYGQALQSVGFTPVIAGSKYEKVVNTHEGMLAEHYVVEMNYVDPSEPYGNTTFGHYFPMGNFQITYYMYTSLIVSIDTVLKFNQYLSVTAADAVAPRLPETGAFASSEVRQFTDNTELANQCGGDWLFLTNSTDYFRVVIPNYEDAVDFYNELLENCAYKGFDHVETSPLLPITFITDFANSKITVDNVPMLGETTYNNYGYVQIQYAIRNNYNQTFTFDIGKDAGVDSIHRISPTNYFIAPGTKVTFSFDLKSGYAFDKFNYTDTILEITKETGENTYSFIMPTKNVTINIVTKTAATGVEFEKSYFVWINNDGYAESRERVAGHTCHLMEMIFHEDGTMTYKRTRYTPSGGIHSGPYTMDVNFVLLENSFTYYYVSGDNSNFDKWRLFDSQAEGTFNPYSSISDGVITVQVFDSSATERTIHLELGEE